MSDYLALLETMGQRKQYKPNEIVFFEGEMPNKFFLLLNGKVRIYKSLDLGIEKTLHTFYAQSFIAEMPSFKNIPYPASAVCEEESVILVIDSQVFKRQLDNTEFCFTFIHSLLNKIKILENHIATTQQPLQKRVLHFCLQNQTSLPTLSQRQIAQILNTTAESLSRILKTLRNENFIEVKKGKISLTDKLLKQGKNIL